MIFCKNNSNDKLKNIIILSRLRNLYCYLITAYGIIYYFLFRSSNKRIYHAMVSLHATSNGKSTSHLNKIINIIEKVRYGRGCKLINLNDELIFDKPYRDNENIVKNLHSNGYCLDENKLQDALISEILLDENSFEGQLLLLNNEYVEHQSLMNARNRGDSVRLQYYSDSLLKSSGRIGELANSTYFLKIAESFLGTFPYLDSVTAWRSFPMHNYLKPSSNAAQLFHYDLDRLSWIKIFMYFNNVGNGDGPHVYIEGSHLAAEKRAEILSRGYVRVPDEELSLIYGPTKIKKVFGPAGSILYGNTLAFHKGEPPINKERFILELQYTSNNYGVQSVKIKDKEIVNQIFLGNKNNANKKCFELL